MGWLVSGLVGCLVGWLVRWLVGSLGWLIGCVGWLVGWWLAGWLFQSALLGRCLLESVKQSVSACSIVSGTQDLQKRKKNVFDNWKEKADKFEKFLKASGETLRDSVAAEKEVITTVPRQYSNTP